MHKVIFDTDPGVDDAMALLFLHASPEVELLGITTTFGNGTIETTTRNALYPAERFGIDVPVARGAAAAAGRRGERAAAFRPRPQRPRRYRRCPTSSPGRPIRARRTG